MYFEMYIGPFLNDMTISAQSNKHFFPKVGVLPQGWGKTPTIYNVHVFSSFLFSRAAFAPMYRVRRDVARIFL